MRECPELSRPRVGVCEPCTLLSDILKEDRDALLLSLSNELLVDLIELLVDNRATSGSSIPREVGEMDMAMLIERSNAPPFPSWSVKDDRDDFTESRIVDGGIL